MKNLNSKETEKYLEIVKKGNMDDMFNFGFELGKQEPKPTSDPVPVGPVPSSVDPETDKK